jgi:hypothetical protein
MQHTYMLLVYIQIVQWFLLIGGRSLNFSCRIHIYNIDMRD